MRTPVLALGLAAVLAVSAGLAAQAQIAGQAAVQPPASAGPPPGPGRGPPPPLPPATEATAPRTDTRHKAFLETVQKGDIDLLFVGDSITDWWQMAGRGLPVWQQRYVPLKAADIGVAGDTTQGVLWRVRNGELDGFKARLIVFMLGTNNINRNDNADIAAGDAAIVAEFRKHQPQAKVLILGIFPRGAAPGNDYRSKIKDINSRLAQLADNRDVFYLDIGDSFLTPDGTLTTEIMADGLHPTTKGYGLWADAMDAKVKELMK